MRIVGILFILTAFAVNAQVLDNRNGDAFTDKPFFNTEFIKKNKLKRLTGSYVYKKRGDIMRDTEYKQVYEFDRLGNLVSNYETRTDDGTKDTVWNIYQYDERGNLVKHKKTDLEGYNTIEYVYDSLNRVVKELHFREIDTADQVAARSLLFNEERIEYADYGSQKKRTRYNNYNLPYLDEFFEYNDLGYLIERSERIKMTSTVYTYEYEYNDTGRLSTIKKRSNQKDGILEKLSFKYDALGNLMEKRIYKNGEFITDIQIVYSNNSKLLSSVITRQVSTGFITILRFKDYEFYD